MPTGYTSVLYEGEKNVTMSDFVMMCARAFGALVMMRDEPLDAPIPERFEPSSFAANKLSDAKSALEKYRTMRLSDAHHQILKEHADKVASSKRDYNKKLALRERYENMIAQIEQWEPPTNEHTELKRFCLQQLRDSLEVDCDVSYINLNPTKPTADQWLKSKIEQCEHDIAYWTDEHEEEVGRTNRRNEWLSALRDSLK